MTSQPGLNINQISNKPSQMKMSAGLDYSMLRWKWIDTLQDGVAFTLELNRVAELVKPKQ